MTTEHENKSNEYTIVIGTDYTNVPGGRYISHGDFSGEDFRETHIIPQMSTYSKINIFLDGTVGYAGSFLEEAFGGLFRSNRVTKDDVIKKINVCIKDPKYSIYKKMVDKYMADAQKKRA